MDTQTAYITELDKKLITQQRDNLELLKEMQIIEVENESYRNEIVDMKAAIETYRAHVRSSTTLNKSTTEMYKVVKGDHIDEHLGDFINNYPGTLSLWQLFTRTREGVYQFGTKSVCICVENDYINVRVGGGYLSIEEFIDQYAGLELEKIERKEMRNQFHSTSGSGKSMITRQMSPVKKTSKITKF